MSGGQSNLSKLSKSNQVIDITPADQSHLKHNHHKNE